MNHLEGLKAETIEEGRGHPFVEALIRTLQMRHRQYHRLIEENASSATGGAITLWAAKACEITETLKLITTTEGKPE